MRKHEMNGDLRQQAAESTAIETTINSNEVNTMNTVTVTTLRTAFKEGNAAMVKAESNPLSGFIREHDGTFRTKNTLTADQIIQAGRQLVIEQFRDKEHSALTSPNAVREYLGARLEGMEQEVFMVLFLDNRHRVITDEVLFYGTINAASVYPREVVKRALVHNAAALIVAHNHPSGDSSPSRADIQITQRLKDALALVDVRLLDHIIIGCGSSHSLAESGDL
ncbi:RadC family protein [Marinobacterium sediminicola]|uniref:RadC-like JAB domain-containing protein n=2 Tax=Marinobacterium sediminicola TaxID=518898 RepID=A0ABY1RXT8_9GAMM|nr:DNA repair protein RadC [Marinobacterium sediminicola]ULG68559.1 DNA repair protein RadC [Marinobacterium sediminicola]SMR73075.1 RadC-like JAB domain-containing protein [Marinobacterium sediminicola]